MASATWPVILTQMSTVTEIEAALDRLDAEPLRAVLRHVQARINRLTVQRSYYDDGHGSVSDDDLIAEADAAFLVYDLDEERRQS